MLLLQDIYQPSSVNPQQSSLNSEALGLSKNLQSAKGQMKYCYSKGLKPEYPYLSLCVMRTLSMRIPLVKNDKIQILCQGGWDALPGGTNIGCNS